MPDGAPVEYVQTESGRVAMAYFSGFMAGLDNVRNALRAWALTQGEEVTGRPSEIYKNGIDPAFTAEGEYEVYWRSEEHTSELQSLMRISYAVFCLKKKTRT